MPPATDGSRSDAGQGPSSQPEHWAFVGDLAQVNELAEFLGGGEAGARRVGKPG